MKKKNIVKEYNYKVPNGAVKIYFNKVVKRFEWNKNTANFELVEKDLQREIDVYKGNDLKTLINKNIYPETTNKGIFADTTIFNNSNFYNINDALNSDLILENEKYEKDADKDIKQNTDNNTKTNKNNNESGN